MRNVELRITNYVYEGDTDTTPIQVGRVENYQALELYDNEPVNVTLQAQDLKNPTTRRLSYAGSFKIPATNKNNELLVWSYLLNQSQGFITTTDVTPIVEPYDINLFNSPIKAQLYVNGFYIFDGELQLTNIERAVTGINYEVTFILNNYSFFTLLKDIKFGEEYRSRVSIPPAILVGDVIIPENWIWDSIIFDKRESNEKVFFPRTADDVYPNRINKDVTAIIDHWNSSWEYNPLPANPNERHYWSFIDDGKMQVVQNANNVRNVNNSYPLITNMTTAPVISVNAFSFLETVRPQYYTIDIIKRIFRFVEYMLNIEQFGVQSLINNGDGGVSNNVNYPDYNNPTFTYPNIPIRFYYGEGDDLFGNYKQLFSRLVCVNPENNNYPNGKLNCTINVSGRQIDTGSVFLNFRKFPIEDHTEPSGDTFKWEDYGIAFMELQAALTSPLVNYNITYKIIFDSINFLDITLNGQSNAIFNRKHWFGFGAYSLLPSKITNNLPAGYTSSNYIDLNTPFNTIDNQQERARAIEKWKKCFVLWKDYQLNSDETSASNPDFNTAFDLRRYLYPSLSDYSMGDFLVEVFRLFNAKIDSPIFKAQEIDSSSVTIRSFNETAQSINILNLEEGINIFNLKKKQQFFKDFTIKYAENGDSLQKYFTENLSPALPFGSRFVNFNNNQGFAQNSLQIELKCGIPTYIPALELLGSGGYSWPVPSVFNITSINQSEVFKADAVTSHPTFFLFNNRTFTYTAPSSVTVVKQLGPKRINTASLNHNLPLLSPFYGRVTLTDPRAVLMYDIPASAIKNNFNRCFGELVNSQSNGYNLFYRDELNSLQGSTILEGNVDLSLTGLFNINFNTIYTVRINGEFAYFRLNKLTNYNLAEDGMAKIELIEFDYISNRHNLYGAFIAFDANNQTKATNQNTSIMNITITPNVEGSVLTFDLSKDIVQYVTVNSSTEESITIAGYPKTITGGTQTYRVEVKDGDVTPF